MGTSSKGCSFSKQVHYITEPNIILYPQRQKMNTQVPKHASTKYIHYFVQNEKAVGTVKDAVFLSIKPWHNAYVNILRIVT